MAIIRLQSDIERQKRLYYEFDSSDKPLGEGGMGKVYKGRCVDERTGMYKEVAIKFMFSDLPEHAIERARREASIRLRNDNLVEMLGFIETTEKNVMGEGMKRYHVVSELRLMICYKARQPIKMVIRFLLPKNFIGSIKVILSNLP